jgi:hypothetical protein
MNLDKIMEMVTLCVMGACLASIPWCLYVRNMEIEAIDRGVAHWKVSKSGNVSFRWSCPQIITK